MTEMTKKMGAPTSLGDPVFALGLPVYQSYLVPRDRVFHQTPVGTNRDGLYIHPSTYMKIKHGRTPFWTRHMPGVREAERDRRRR